MLSKEDLDRFEVKITLLEASQRKPPEKGMTAHELAKRLLALPDHPLVIIKGEGGGYISEHDVQLSGPWVDGHNVCVPIKPHLHGVQATAKS